MKIEPRRAAAAIGLWAATVAATRAGDPPTVADPVAEDAAGPPVVLVEADSLGRWEDADYGGQGVCEVSGGVLGVGAGDPFTAVVWTGPVGGEAEGALPRTNYRIDWEARRTLGSDFFSTLTFPVGEDVCSLVLGGWGGMVTGLSTLDEWDAVRNNTCDSRTFENGRWYKFRVTVRPDEVAATMDGERLFYAIDPRKYAVAVRIEMEPATPLSFSSYLSSGEIRNATLTPLKPREPKPLDDD